MRKYIPSIERIRHIETEGRFILEATKGKSPEQFYADETLKRAAAKAFDVIGEASTYIDPVFKEAHKDVEWHFIAVIQEMLIHHNKKIDYSVIWEPVRNTIPEMHFQMQHLLEKYNES